MAGTTLGEPVREDRRNPRHVEEGISRLEGRYALGIPYPNLVVRTLSQCRDDTQHRLFASETDGPGNDRTFSEMRI